MKKIITSFLIAQGIFLISQLSTAQIIHVPEDYPTIQQGIDAASPGDTILVADGIYNEQINFLGKKPLVVASHFVLDGDTIHINNTIIDGSQLTNMDMASVVYFNSGEDTTSSLCGFTITGGKGTYVPGQNERCGGGIFVSGSGARIIHNKITGNILDDTQPVNGQNVFGGGIGTPSEYGENWLVIESNQIAGNTCITQYETANGGGIHSACHCRIHDNNISDNICLSTTTAGYAAGGGIGHSGGVEAPNVFIIRNNKIHHNVVEATAFSSGGAAFLNACQLSFNDNEIIENQAINEGVGPSVGGISILDPSAEIRQSNNITHNTFKGNKGRNGGGAIFLRNNVGIPDPAVVSITHNYFLENESVNGGAIVSWSAPMQLENNIFKDNYASLRGGAIFLDKGIIDNLHLAIMINNTFWNNTSDSKGGAIFSNKARPLSFNNIFFGDQAPEGPEIYLNFTTDTLDVTFSNIDLGLVYGSTIGWGENISADPGFDETCHIEENSPCEDAGALVVTIRDEDFAAPGDDIDGTSRPWHLGIDIGADECDIITSLPDQVLMRSEAKCYPNPTSGIVDCQLSIVDCQCVSMKLYDHQGREVSVLFEGRLNSGERTIRFDMSGLPAGIYFYRLTGVPACSGTGGERGTANGKIVKY